jgi:hypothetical protein
VSRSILLVLSSRIGWSLRCIIFVDLGHGLGITVLIVDDLDCCVVRHAAFLVSLGRVAAGGTGILAVTDFDYVDTSGEAHDQRKDLRHR